MHVVHVHNYIYQGQHNCNKHKQSITGRGLCLDAYISRYENTELATPLEIIMYMKFTLSSTSVAS